MAKTYIYKIKRKFKKNPEILTTLLGFIPYQESSDKEFESEAEKEAWLSDVETIYARGIILSQDTDIFKHLVRVLEKMYMKATTEERKEFDASNIKFNEIINDKQQRDYKLILTEQIIKDFTECQICFANKGTGAWSLFINAPDNVEYYSTDVVDQCAPDVVELLKKEGVIYKARVWRK